MTAARDPASDPAPQGSAELGHHADAPSEIPRRAWIAVLGRVWRAMNVDHIGLIAAGVAFYGLLALFPAITASMAIGGIVLNPPEVAQELQKFAGVLPQQAADIVLAQVNEVTGSRSEGLQLTALLGVALALWSASRGVGSLIEGLNVAYGEREKRGFFLRILVTLALTMCLIVGLLAGLSAALVLPTIFAIIDLGVTAEILLRGARWILLTLMTILGLSFLYRFGPSRRAAKWRWLTPGAVLACGLWLAASVGFSAYVSNFASYNESFGAIAGVVILLMWLWISAYAVLVGAALNAESELQTRVDSTKGPDRPMGERGAEVADTPPPGTGPTPEPETEPAPEPKPGPGTERAPSSR
ncbi:YihY/virulence factor BrkB family protein [Albimonas sp. CAU 1670]|uniref:YihY/virulence factor BrkB family protein n=1 Tax=Albimonas sp. CAU 1670 TaxID=3032599 RepID=UPI0023DC7952|nr:YihY/virulence factor BrkB family protein [Albimonas sp. CAU 1670]MDF2234870.1 YihY/virulence factor BrkB family protein [Albimonas sp. CAU 1670]